MPKYLLRLLRYIAVAWVFGITLWLYYFKPNWTNLSKTRLTHDKLHSLFALSHGRHPSLASILIRLGVYDEIYSQINVYDFLRKYSFEGRCMLYFNHLSMSDPEWLVDPNEAVSFDQAAFDDFDQYRNDTLSKWSKSVKKAEEEGKSLPEKPTDDQMLNDLKLLRKTVLSYEQKLHDFVSHVRVFDKCYMDPSSHWNDTNYIKEQQKFLSTQVNYQYSDSERDLVGKAYKEHIECDEIAHNIFPFLTNEYPLYMRWNGDTPSFPGSNYRKGPPKGCFLGGFKQRINGKGVVMTIGDGHIEVVSRILRVLRYFRNSYPIQIVYHDKLLQESRDYLIRIAREEFHDYPPQDLWFVDVSPSISGKYRSKFSGYGNKILAVMLNSFEDMFLLDADAVLLKDINYFFSLKNYVQSGAFFYKDRFISTRLMLEMDIVFFKKLLPSVDDSMVFNIQQTTNYTLSREFFRSNFKYYMESGAVVLNRKKHFIQPFVMAILNFYNLVVSRIWGEKELFWLAFVYLGNENYYFNENFAASIGEITPESERQTEIKRIKAFRSKEVCSGHPSHISDEDDSLVWFNSGFRYCVHSKNKDMDFQKDFDRGLRYSKYKTVEEFRTFFESQMKITHAIIPPFTPDHSKAVNFEHEPEVGWVPGPYCRDYTWCAYSLIGGEYKDTNGEVKSNHLEGKMIEFSELDQKHFEAVGNIWMAELPDK